MASQLDEKDINRENFRKEMVTLQPLDQVLSRYPEVKILSNSSEYSHFICHDYSLLKILDHNPFRLDNVIMDSHDRMVEVLKEHFEPISEPRDGDLIVYYIPSDRYLRNHREGEILPPSMIAHSGIVRKDNRVESLIWNICKEFIVEMPRFYYNADEVHYFRKKS